MLRVGADEYRIAARNGCDARSAIFCFLNPFFDKPLIQVGAVSVLDENDRLAGDSFFVQAKDGTVDRFAPGIPSRHIEDWLWASTLFHNPFDFAFQVGPDDQDYRIDLRRSGKGVESVAKQRGPIDGKQLLRGISSETFAASP